MSNEIQKRLFQIFNVGCMDMAPKEIFAVGEPHNLKIKFTRYPPVDSTQGTNSIKIGPSRGQMLRPFADMHKGDPGILKDALL